MAERGLSSHRRKRRRLRIRRFVTFVFLFVLLYLLLTSSIIEVSRVSDNAMAPGVREGDVILSSPLLLRLQRLRRVQRGDLVLLENPGAPELTFGGHLLRRLIRFLGVGNGSSSKAEGSPLLLRRVLGLPGERVLLDEYRFRLRRDNRWVGEEELFSGDYELLLPRTAADQIPWPGINTPGSPDSPAQTIAEDRYYLLADNRGAPMDSRLWGTIGTERLHGRVFLRILPLSRFGPLRGK